MLNGEESLESVIFVGQQLRLMFLTNYCFSVWETTFLKCESTGTIHNKAVVVRAPPWSVEYMDGESLPWLCCGMVGLNYLRTTYLQDCYSVQMQSQFVIHCFTPVQKLCKNTARQAAILMTLQECFAKEPCRKEGSFWLGFQNTLRSTFKMFFHF